MTYQHEKRTGYWVPLVNIRTVRTEKSMKLVYKFKTLQQDRFYVQ